MSDYLYYNSEIGATEQNLLKLFHEVLKGGMREPSFLHDELAITPASRCAIIY